MSCESVSTSQRLAGEATKPVGVLVVALRIALATAVSETPACSRRRGSSDTRTAGEELPPTLTSPTPGTCRIGGAMRSSASR